jgi:hypothetical protein
MHHIFNSNTIPHTTPIFFGSLAIVEILESHEKGKRKEEVYIKGMVGVRE